MYNDYINYSIATSEKHRFSILCRMIQITEDEYNNLLQIIKKLGYDSNKLVLTEID